MAEEGQTQQTQQTASAGSGNGPPTNQPPPVKSTPRRRATDVAPMQMDATPIAEAVAGAVKSVLEEVFGKQEQQGNTGDGQQQQQQQKQEEKPKRRGSWFWGGN